MADIPYRSIKNWDKDDRPREKMLKLGIKSLSNSELLAIIIGSGTKKISAVELGKQILSQYHNKLDELARLSIEDLCEIKGIGEAKAVSILASVELGRRMQFPSSVKKQKITSSQDAYNVIYPIIGEIPHEEFWIILLNRSNTVIDKKRISQGGVSGTVIDVKMILKMAISQLASSIIICHNHPSGNITPSQNDKKITYKLSKAATTMDIKLLDHIIIGDKTYLSFLDEGLV